MAALCGMAEATGVRSRMQGIPPNDSWKVWFREHGPRLVLIARQWTRSRADAEDVVQEAFVRYWRHQRGVDGEAFPLLVTSLRRAALDLARSSDRRAAREQASQVGEDPWFEPPLPGGTGGEERLEQALRGLPEDQREVISLKVWGEMTFEEIGRTLSIPPNTAASRYRYALAALRKRLSPSDLHV